MKLVHKGNLYIQRKDLLWLNTISGILPLECTDAFFPKGIITVNYDLNELIQVHNSNLINLLEKCAWLADYHVLNSYSNKDLETLLNVKKERLKELENKFYNVSDSNKKNDILNEIHLLDYEIECLKDITIYRNNNYDLEQQCQEYANLNDSFKR